MRRCGSSHSCLRGSVTHVVAEVFCTATATLVRGFAFSD